MSAASRALGARPCAWQRAIDAFLSQPDLATSTRRSYAQTLGALSAALGDPDIPSAERLETALTLRWQSAAPATWNRNVATLSSCLAYAERHRLLPGIDLRLDRRRVRGDASRAIAGHEVKRILALDAPLREKALWRLLYETAARVPEVLSLNVEDLDLPNHCAAIIGRGGGREFICWQTGSSPVTPRGRPADQRAAVCHRSPCPPRAGACRPVSAHRPGAAVLAGELDALADAPRALPLTEAPQFCSAAHETPTRVSACRRRRRRATPQSPASSTSLCGAQRRGARHGDRTISLEGDRTPSTAKLQTCRRRAR